MTTTIDSRNREEFTPEMGEKENDFDKTTRDRGDISKLDDDELRKRTVGDLEAAFGVPPKAIRTAVKHRAELILPPTPSVDQSHIGAVGIAATFGSDVFRGFERQTATSHPDSEFQSVQINPISRGQLAKFSLLFGLGTLITLILGLWGLAAGVMSAWSTVAVGLIALTGAIFALTLWHQLK